MNRAGTDLSVVPIAFLVKGELTSNKSRDIKIAITTSFGYLCSGFDSKALVSSERNRHKAVE
jgi:hypothetical protein